MRPCCTAIGSIGPDEAARCLEQGGLWTEAIALYEELGEHEKAGDLYWQLDQPDPARQAYRAAVAKILAENDCLAAARVLESKLDVPDEARSVRCRLALFGPGRGMFRGTARAVGPAGRARGGRGPDRAAPEAIAAPAANAVAR